MQFRRGDVVQVNHGKNRPGLYKKPEDSIWQGVGIVRRVYTRYCVSIQMLWNGSCGAFDTSDIELLGHIELEEGEKQNANRR